MKTNWQEIADRALVYVEANAWGSAEACILPHITAVWDRNTLPVECIHTAAVLVLIWRRLGKLDPAEKGTEKLRRAVAKSAFASSEAGLSVSLCFAADDFAKGRYEATEKSLRVADDYPREQVTAWSVCRRELLWSRLHLFRNQLADCEDRALTAARYAAEGHNDGQLGDAYVVLAVVARRRGRMRESITLFEKARSCYLRIGDSGANTVVSLNLGSSFAACGEIDEAVTHYTHALRLARRAGRQGTAIRALLGQGYCLIRMGRVHQARKGLLTAWRSAKRCGLAREVAIACEYLVFLYVMTLRTKQAKVALRLAERGASKVDDPPDLTLQIALQRARLFLLEGQVSDAIASARAVSREAERQGLRWEQAMALMTLGVAHVHRGARSRAEKVLREARKIFEEDSEVLDKEIVSAWLLMMKFRDREKGRAAVERKAGLIDAERESLKSALKHEVLGPLGWARARIARRSSTRAGGGGRLSREGGRPMPPAFGSPDVGCSAEIWHELGLQTHSAKVRRVLHAAETYASARLPVLILGETGTGKDLVAQGIHDLSGCGGLYVPVNCAAASRELFAAELFGARKGAYTGAVENREGLVVRASGGSIFLDEIADLDLEAQGYLLRFLDSGEVRPVGSSESKRVDARVIAATCRDLRAMVQKGRFRADLLNRLSGLRVRLPALRERLEDLELLIESLWVREGGIAGAWPGVFNRAIVGRLSREPWPGNVRELRHMVARALQFSRKHGDAAARQELLRDLEDPHRYEAESAEAARTEM